MGKGANRELFAAQWKIITLLFLILLLFATPTIIWLVSPSQVLNIWVLDKTVPNRTYREHRGLFWVLNYFKFRKGDKKSLFMYNRDYYGFFPNTREEYTTVELHSATPENPDLIYLADTYGVYESDYLEEESAGQKSPLIYGGLSNEDIFTLKTNLRDRVTLIAEYNTFNTPTSEENRKQMEEILGIKWQEWMGRYFLNLEKGKEITAWMVEAYEKQYDKEWGFTGPGYVLISNWNDIIVLENKVDLGGADMFVAFENGFADEFGIAQEIPYYYWFDFIQPTAGTEVCAQFHLDLTETGLQKLQKVGLNATFPAILRKKTIDYVSYYLAGDMADHEAAPWNYMISGSHWIRRWFSLNLKGEASSFYWRAYVPMMRKILNEVLLQRKDVVPTESKALVYQENDLTMISRINGNNLEVYTKTGWNPLFIKGINMGMAVPGKWFTEFPRDEATYTRWLNWIGEMNCNAIRVYTLMDPSFYRALYTYNLAHEDQPLWLMQGIWPQENPANNNYLDPAYHQEFLKEIEYGVDAVHGNIQIQERTGRASGVYQADVSPYVIAYLVGRELEATEALANDQLNKGYLFQGEYFQTKQGASPTEGWLAESCEGVVHYEIEKYQWSRPVSIVSWPTMDVLEHESEWEALTDKSNQFNDLTSININHIETTKQYHGGFFGTYHIYPNYPDFMNNDERYMYYHDEQGQFMYGGYLRDFILAQSKYPAFVGEFGLANGMGNAHSNPDGLHHGSHTEEQQGLGIVRMMKAIRREKYMGGAVFEWMDEWAKKTWTTEPFMIPYDRHVLWHNMVCPEQNYGILANEAMETVTSEYTLSDGEGLIEKMEVRTNEEYFFLDIHTRQVLDLQDLVLHIGLDTYLRYRGENYYTPDKSIQAPSGMEFKVEISQGKARLLVIPSYNFSRLKFASKNLANGVFETMNPIINKSRTTKRGRFIPAVYEDASQMLQGPFDGTKNSWFQEGKRIRIRIPWQRLLVTDPSSQKVLNDVREMNSYPLRDIFKTINTEGFVISAIVTDQARNLLDIFPGDQSFDNPVPYLWKGWEQPRYRERLKESYEILQRFFKDFAE